MKVLVVDSDLTHRDALVAQLSAEGFTAFSAGDGESVLIAFDEHAPDLVLLEKSLPGLDGAEVCEALKERAGTTFIPIVFIASIENAGEKTAGYDAGADDFIVKPLDFKELVARIKSLRKIQGIANRDQRTLTGLTYSNDQRSYDEVMKVVADHIGPGKKTLFRFRCDEETGYLAVEGARFVHARLGDLTGRAAIERMLVWPAEQFESVAFLKLKPSLDVDFGEYVDWWSSRLDFWRLVSEKLPAKQTILQANGLRQDELLDLPAELGTVFSLFSPETSIDEAVRRSPAEIAETLKAVGNLFYRGLLRRTLPPSDLSASPTLLSARNGADNAGAPQAEAQQQIEELQLEALTLSSVNNKLSDELAQLQKRVEEQANLQRLLAEREQSAAAHESRLEELDTAMVALKRRYASRLKDIATKSNDGIIDSVVEQLSMDLQDAHSFAVTVQHSKTDAERKVAALQEELGSLKYALEEKNRLQERLQIQQQSATLNEGSRLVPLQAEISSLKKQLAESSANRQKLQEQLQSAARQSDGKLQRKAQEDLAALRNQLTESNRLRQSLQDQVEQAALAKEEALRKVDEELVAVRVQLLDATKTRDQLVQKLAQAGADEQAKALAYEQEIARLKDAATEDGESPLFLESSEGAESPVNDELERELSETRAQALEWQAEAEKARSEFEALETKLLFLETEASHLRPALAQSELNLNQVQRRLSEQEALFAEQAARLAAWEEERQELESRLSQALAEKEEVAPAADGGQAEESLRVQNLEEEIALIKTALTESMVKSERLEAELQLISQAQEEKEQVLVLKQEAVEKKLAEALAREEELNGRLGQASDSDSAKSQQLEKELAFVKAKYTELQSAAQAKIQQYEKYSDGLKTKLEEVTQARQVLEQKLANSADHSAASENQVKQLGALRNEVAELQGRAELAEQKLDLAQQSANKNALMNRAQEQADKLHLLKNTVRQQESEIEQLRAELAKAASGNQGQAPGAAEQDAGAQIQDLNQKIEVLRMTLLERDEEIVELTAQLDTLQSVGG